ncbi:MAG: metallophosphoesterase family protein [Bacillota bacterium]
MRLGLVSDSHGELENLRTAARLLVEEWQAELLVHLGDECEDAAVLERLPVKVLQVPGVYCEHYLDPEITNRMLKEFSGYRVLFTHTPTAHKNDLPQDPDPVALAAQGKVDVIAYGHTHVPEIRAERKVLWINPGHLKEHDKKGYSPSFAVLDLAPEVVRGRIVDLHSGVVFQGWEGSLR